MNLQFMHCDLTGTAATRKSTLVYCVDDPHAVKLLAMFRNANINARHIPLKVCEAKPKSDDHLLYETEMGTLFFVRSTSTNNCPNNSCLRGGRVSRPPRAS